MRIPCLFFLAASLLPAQVKFVTEPDRVKVLIDGKPYTDFIERGGEAMKPYLYPLRSASGKVVTRYFPIEKVEGEPTDHPHQRGLWFAHDRVNGFDFWNNETTYKTPNRGSIEVEKIVSTKDGSSRGSLTALMGWKGADGVKLLEERRVMTFGKTNTLRTIELDITLTATADKVTFGDSKDGVLGIRLAPVLQESKSTGRGVVDNMPHTGKISNAEGKETEANVWGKASDWMDYTGMLEGEKLGITILDHPANSRRTRWHVRGYGLFAANPFGRKTFDKAEAENGEVELAKGGKLHFRYLVVIHPGDAKDAAIAKLWADFSKKK